MLIPPLCNESRLDHQARLSTCHLETGHPGPHEDARGETWEPPGVVLERLRKTWGRTHRIAWTGSLWMATAYDRTSHWRTEIEPTPDQLEERLRTRAKAAPSPIPRPRASGLDATEPR
ncbi:hypothetical protein PWG71_16770 [Nocardiopsis sp. N85]|uniref:hypothetical protein n=1 Tax=Nocardiopsis sp. N85 TaxID=3029400 RepID=UPI00237F9AFD|nr:hypothetical protein [Nocardiopsis sp. N85]MDE3723045.1 hypothetical protein [Nocardiopsis sp. N85]